MKNSKQKILIFRLGAIGDVIHTTVIAQAIKEKYADAEIHYLTDTDLIPLVELSPYIDKILGFDKTQKKNFSYLKELVLELRKEQYDIVFNLSNSLKNTIISMLLFPKKLINRKKMKKHAVFAFFKTAKNFLKDLELPEKLNIQVKPKLKEKIEKNIEKYPRPYFVFNPAGANNNAREGRIWDIIKWRELGTKLVEKYNGTIFVCGSKKEAVEHADFKKMANTVVLSGELTIEESAALYSISDIVISGDSGPLHLADAIGTKTVALMGSTPPKLCGPYGQLDNVVQPQIKCKYCRKKKCKKKKREEKITPCMQSISADNVMLLIDKLLVNSNKSE